MYLHTIITIGEFSDQFRLFITSTEIHRLPGSLNQIPASTLELPYSEFWWDFGTLIYSLGP